MTLGLGGADRRRRSPLIALPIAAIIAISLAGCGDSGGDSDEVEPASAADSTPEVTTATTESGGSGSDPGAEEADAEGVGADGTDIGGADGTDIGGADNDSADLDSADLDSADLDSADLDSADLDSAGGDDVVPSTGDTESDGIVASSNWSIGLGESEFSPDLELLIGNVRLNSELRVYDTSTGDLLRTMSGHSGDIWSLDVSHDGALIATGDQNGEIRIWNGGADPAQDEVMVLENAHQATVRGVAFNNDATVLASVGGNVLRLWDLEDGSLRDLQPGLHERGPTAVTFSEDGSRIVTGGTDGKIEIGDPIASRQIETLDAPDFENMQILTLSPDGRFLAALTSGGAGVYDLDNPNYLPLPIDGSETAVAAFTPDSSTLVTGSEDNLVRFWDPATAEETAEAYDIGDWVSQVGFSDDGTLMIVHDFEGLIHRVPLDRRGTPSDDG